MPRKMPDAWAPVFPQVGGCWRLLRVPFLRRFARPTPLAPQGLVTLTPFAAFPQPPAHPGFLVLPPPSEPPAPHPCPTHPRTFTSPPAHPEGDCQVNHPNNRINSFLSARQVGAFADFGEDFRASRTARAFPADWSFLLFSLHIDLLSLLTVFHQNTHHSSLKMHHAFMPPHRSSVDSLTPNPPFPQIGTLI